MTLEIHLEAEMVSLRDTLGGCDRASLDMHLEANIVELRDALRGLDQASFEMFFEATIDQDGRSTWRWLIWWL